MTIASDPKDPNTAKPAHSRSPPPTANPDPNAPPIKRRAPIACRRCRRMRSKCIHDKAPPCKSCLEANVPDECSFPSRGDLDQDRSFRHPRQRSDRKFKSDVRVKKESPASPGHIRNSLSDCKLSEYENEWDLLPAVDIVVDGINNFTRNFFQLGFIPKKRFPALVKENPSSVSVFLLLSILAISARFNESLIEAFGDGIKAATEFMRRAQGLAVHELYQQPTLERCQAFYLLSIAEQGSGKSNTSYISAGISFRMAALMRLHREEAYSPITSQSPIEHRILAESARRTFWMLHSQDNLHSGPYKPLSLAPGDITALLPSDEEEFENGKIPEQRAALEGTPPAIQNPSLTILRPRSLFASLMQIHNLWGIIARRVLFNKRCGRPHDSGNEFAKLNRRLMDFEQNLPNDHTFGKVLLGGYRVYGVDLAYLGLTGSIRLCHIVLRKEYMEDMIRHAQGNPSNPEVKFYNNMAAELFFNVRKLYSQIDAHYENGIEIGRVGSQMAGFIIYGCGLLASYLCKFPQLDAHHAGQNLETIQAEGRAMYTRIVSVLRECQKVWPLAETWCNGLEKWYEDPNPKRISFQAGTMTDGKEPQPHVLNVLHPPTTTTCLQKSECISFGPLRSTPPRAHTHVEERSQPDVGKGPEPHRLAPLQQTHPGLLHPVCLPPLSQTPYGAHHPQPTPPPPQHSPQLPHPPQIQSYAQQPYVNTNTSSSGLNILASSSHQPPASDPYQQHHTPYYPEYPSLNDGFDNNLQIMVNGAEGQWSGTDVTGVAYGAFDIPSYLPHS
ncbi:uncharacterized protein GGS22DRAFT_126269 [Annulohypoxylon maeteangense]|uniref:uncharacterized protein n=1 Tax=Annulohypoxylon maeteangense TaxID=1927788 RepID=UPI002007C09E|nr:uncharacterized protein GGS22DRAFT_126269 [Annulohypoxylon maeteangense]KAI0886238.1 hypothetical protein GGS22DRAFT_126269 [Annulohypoxylon maeteangense]